MSGPRQPSADESKVLARIGEAAGRMAAASEEFRNGTEDCRLRSDPQIQADYGDLLALYPDHPITMDGTVLRWKRNPLMNWICDVLMKTHALNDMAVAYQREIFPLEDYTKFYRDIGYSLSGFIEIFGEELGLYAVEEPEI